MLPQMRRQNKNADPATYGVGGFSAINALANQQIEKAYFISPVVDMERLIADMMIWANVTEDELKEKKEIQTTFGETLSWDYLCYVRENPIIWKIQTHILYGEKDNFTAYGTIFEFAQRTNSTLSITGNHLRIQKQGQFLILFIGRFQHFNYRPFNSKIIQTVSQQPLYDLFILYYEADAAVTTAHYVRVTQNTKSHFSDCIKTFL